MITSMARRCGARAPPGISRANYRRPFRANPGLGARGICRYPLASAERGSDDALRFLLNLPQMFGAAPTFGVDLVHIFGARGTRGEPAMLGNHLEPADGRIITGCARQDGSNLFAGEFRGFHAVWRELREPLLLRRRGGGVDALEQGLAELPRELAIGFAGVAAGTRRDLRRQQRRCHAVLVRGPHRAALAQERGASALFA